MYRVPVPVVVGKLDDTDTQALEQSREIYVLNVAKAPSMRKHLQNRFPLKDIKPQKNTFESIHLSDNTEIANLPACADEGVYVSESEKATATSLQKQEQPGKVKQEIKERKKPVDSRTQYEKVCELQLCSQLCDILRGLRDF